jgi:hypothetical protein
MLYALLLLGLLPAAFLIDPASADDDPDDPSAAPPDGLPDGLVEETVDPDSPPADLDVPPDADEVAVSGFRPGVDRIVVRLASADADFSTTEEEGDACLRIDCDDDDERMISFRGLAAVPLEDISISVTDPLSGEVTTFRLSDRGVEPTDPDDGDTLTGGGEDGVDPTDPGVGDTLTGGDDPGVDPTDPGAGDSLTGGDDPGLEPTDPALGDTLFAADPGDPPALEPTDPEAGDVTVPADPGDGTAIDPTDPELGDRRVPAAEAGLEPTDPAGPDGLAASAPLEAFLFDAGRGAPAPVIAGFVPGSDVLAVLADLSAGGADPVVEVHPSQDGADGEVWIGGTLCAVLQGAPHAGPDDLHLATAAA